MLYFGKGNERGRKRSNKADWSNSGLGQVLSASLVFYKSVYSVFLSAQGPATILASFKQYNTNSAIKRHVKLVQTHIKSPEYETI